MSLTANDLVGLFKKQPIGISCGLVSVGLLAFMFSVRAGALDDAQKLLEGKTAKAKDLTDNHAYAKGLDKENAELAATNKDVRDRAVQPRSSLATNLLYFYELEDAAGVKNLGTSQIGSGAPATKAKTTYQPVAYKVSVQGDFAQILGFLQRLEQGTHFIRVLDFRLTPSAREGPEASKLTLILALELVGLPSAP